jgi:hypothetical protein
VLVPIRCCLPLLLLFVCVGCARHYNGRVIVYGRAVPSARVEACGMRGGMITGERLFTVHAVTDSDGTFMLIVPDPVSDITATSPDLKRRGRAYPAVSKPPVVIIIR